MRTLRVVLCALGVGALLLSVPFDALARGGGGRGSRGSKGGEHTVRSYTKKDGSHVPLTGRRTLMGPSATTGARRAT
jgi:hypothetical protein